MKEFIFRGTDDGKILNNESDQELVRCKDCKFMYEDNQFMCGIRGFCVNEDFFCADGERRTE